MKKWMFLLLALCICAGLFLSAPQAQAAEHTNHCTCGGNVRTGNHTCSNVTWEALTTSTVLENGGHYYLQKNIARSVVISDGMEISICLNGFHLYAGIPLKVSNGEVNICNCQNAGRLYSTANKLTEGSTVIVSDTGTLNLYSGKISGAANNNNFIRCVEVNGGTFNMYGGQIADGISDENSLNDPNPGYGGNVYVHSNGCYTMYGGAISGGKASVTIDGATTGCGGNLYGDSSSTISILGGVIENGTAVNGGNLYSKGIVTLDGATITGGIAYKYRGNVYINGTVDLSKNTVSGGIADGKPETVQLLRDGVHLVSDHTSIYAAVNKMWKDAAPETLHLQLSGDITETNTFTQDIYMDLNGHNLSGITVSGTFYGMDTAQTPGKLTCTLNGGQILGIGDYFAVPEDSGVYSFHSIAATVTHISITPANAAMGYKTQLYLADSILERVTQFGYDMWLEGHSVCSYSKPIDQCGTEFSLRLTNILSPNYTQEANAINVDTPIHARPFVILDNGTKLCLTEASYSFHDALEGADNIYSTYSQTQKDALRALFKEYYYLIKYWHVENFHHILNDGTWSEISSKGVLALIRQKNYNGSYVLSEDVDLENNTITLQEGHDLTICLRGHNITGAKQLFRVEGGTLTICDCHYGGNTPGTLTSTLSGESGVFAPVAQLTDSGVMNLYGGQLKGQNLVRSAGVVAVGHQTKESNATFNMYSGSISDGIADYNGGLVAVWHGSTMNMYGGALYNGQCNGDGGGIVIRDGSVVNLYGGQIYNCSSANNGGGIWSTKGGKLYIGDAFIYNNTASNRGGNIYNNSTDDFCLDGATVTGGNAADGGGLYQQAGSVSTMGSTCIYDNQNGDLRMNYNGTLNADGLTEGANVQVSAVIHSKIGTDPSIAQYVTCAEKGYTVKQYNGDMVLWNGNLTQAQNINQFSAGYGRINITPRDENGNLLPVPLAGYGDTEHRLAETVNGELYVTATAITDQSGRTVLLMAADLSGLNDATLAQYIPHISYMTGIPQGDIIITCSHTHSAPAITSSLPIIVQYKQTLPDLFAQAAIDAMNDRQAATMYTGSFDVEGLNFTRHYKYLDANGQWQYSCDNFGERDLDNQINAQHVTQADPTMYLVKLAREEGKDILMINWRAHPTMTGGTTQTVLSSDYVGALRDVMDAQTDMSMIFFQGAAGNINATSRLSWEKHGYTFREYGQVLNDQIVAAMDGGCMTETEPGLWQVDNHTYTATVNHTDDDRLEEAQAFVEEYYETFPGNQESQSVRLAWCAERGWTCVFEASSIVRRAGLGETAQMSLNALSLGDSLGFYTAPGELFDTVSVEMESASPFDMTICLGYSMGTHKYFAYDPNNGGAMTYDSYEGFNSNYLAPDTINDMIAYWKEALKALHSGAQ